MLAQMTNEGGPSELEWPWRAGCRMSSTQTDVAHYLTKATTLLPLMSIRATAERALIAYVDGKADTIIAKASWPNLCVHGTTF